MARLPRIDLPGVPQHLVVRGNNRGDLFGNDNDRTAFLRYLSHAAAANGARIHAFVLMTNHVHLLATGEAAGSISRLIQSVGRRYAHYVNRVHVRTGTLFEGRFRSSLVDSERYLFTCMRYIELNPVRAGIARSPGDSRWSSFRHNAVSDEFGWLVARPEYEALGADPAMRRQAYRALVSAALSTAELEAIREGVRKGCPIGATDFVLRVERILGRPVRVALRGRPRAEKCI